MERDVEKEKVSGESVLKEQGDVEKEWFLRVVELSGGLEK